jgi:hypothetical protein
MKCTPQSPIIGQVSDLVENIVNIVNVHHLENCSWNSSLVNRPSVSMFSTHSIPITFSLRPCQWLFLTEVQALGWWNVLYIRFCFGRPHTAVPERADRSNEISCFPPSLSVIAGLSRVVGQNRVRGFQWQFWILTKFKAKLAIGVLLLLMLHFSVRTHVASWTPTFSSFVHRLFWLFVLCCCAPSVLVVLVRVRIVARLRQFSVCLTVKN